MQCFRNGREHASPERCASARHHSHSEPYGQTAVCWNSSRGNQLVHSTPQEESGACRDSSAHHRTTLSGELAMLHRHAEQLHHYRQFTLWPFAAMLQADDEDDMMEMQMKSPFGSSFRTFNATDYKPIGKICCVNNHNTGFIKCCCNHSLHSYFSNNHKGS